MSKSLYIFTIFFILMGCGQISNENKAYNQDIYNLMKIVINEQGLNLNYGLNIKPEQNFGWSNTDSKIFESLLTEQETNIEFKKSDSISYFYELNDEDLLSDLTKQDIYEMIKQKEKLKSFKWNNSELGFNLSNKNNWYSFSVPLFSADKTKAVMMIRDLCSGLCGSGKTILFTKKNEKWISNTGMIWIH